MMKADGMFEELFSLVRLEIGERIGRERKHPVARQPIQQSAKAQDDGGERQETLDGENQVQPRESHGMVQNRGKTAAVDFLFAGQMRFQFEAIAKQ